MSKHMKVREATDPVSQIVESVKGFVGEAESLLRMTAEFSSDSIDAVKGEFEKKLKQVKRTVHDLEDTAVKRYNDAAETTDQFVHERPWPAIGIAMACGMLIGYLGHRPSQHRR